MKKILLILLFFSSIGSFSQDLEGNVITLRDSMITYNSGVESTIIVPEGNGLNRIKNLSPPLSGGDAVNLDYINSIPLSGWDSLGWIPSTGDISWWTGGSLIGSKNIDGRYAIGNLLDYVRLDDSIDVYVTPKQLIDTVNQYTEKYVYSIRLAASPYVSTRISGATEGVDYPAGWVLAEGSSSVDIDITHNLGRRVALVTIFSINGTVEQQLFNTAAYNGIITDDDNHLRIQSLATINKPIKIYILFI